MENTTIKVTIKVSGKEETFDFEVNMDDTVAQTLDNIVSSKSEFDRSAVTLVRKGRILKNDQTIREIGISDGETLHLVNKATSEADKNEDNKATENKSSNPGFPGMQGMGMPGMGMPGFPGMPGMSMPGMGMPGMPGMGIPNMEMGQPGMEGGAPGGFNPEMMSNILNNPMVKGMISDMFSDPDKIKQVLQANPFLTQMAEGNDEIRK